MNGVAAFILAGGKSSRMGSDKALLELAGKPLVLRAVELAREVTEYVTIVGEPEKFGGYGPVIPDIFPGCGPLGGIHVALANSNSDLTLILAVDLPLLNAEFLKYLIVHARSSGKTVTVPSTDGYFQPLCAVYHKRFARLAENALRSGRNKIDALFPEIDVQVILEEELNANGFKASMFRNLNTPEDWEQVEHEFASKSPQP